MDEHALIQARQEIDEIDEEMAQLFVRRMQAVSRIASYKQAHGLPIFDEAREKEVIARNTARMGDETLRPLYVQSLQETMRLSRSYQATLLTNEQESFPLTRHVGAAGGGYDIHIEHGALARAGRLFALDRRVLVLTDDGVPAAYAAAVCAQCKSPVLVTVAQGEGSKSLSCLESILSRMLEEGFTRTDAVVAVGGGVVGDLGGFVASVYMRGIDFYNIPTTLLAQVDSSVGGKTAINLGGVKNCVGSFYPPRGVLIDPDLLTTLPARQMAAGMAEVIKMAAALDASFFEDLEAGALPICAIIARAIAIKARVVEADEKESGLRRVLNFGHTIGHGIESCTGLLHGECVALGMLPMCAEEVRTRLVALYARYGLPTAFACDADRVVAALAHDKKLDGTCLRTVYVPRIGSFTIQEESLDAFTDRVREVYAL